MPKTLLLKLHAHPSPLWVIFEIAFLRNLSMALLTAILPIYFRSLVNSDAQVGLIYLLGYGTAFIASMYSAFIIEHLRKRKSLLLALVLFTVIFAAYSFASHAAAAAALFAAYQFVLALFVMDVSLYIKHYSNFKNLAQNEGKLGSFGNLGWLTGPFLGGLIADKFGFQYVFYFSALISLIALLIFFFVRISHEETHFHHSRSFAKNIKLFFSDKNLRRTYINNAGLGFVYSIWDFLPLLMSKIGAAVTTIGMAKSLMGVNQTIFEYPVGQMADRETGERKIFIIGYALAAIFMILLGLTGNLRLFIIFFFIAAAGAAFLEMTRDSYFFRQMPEQNVELTAVYRTSDSFSFVIGQSLAVAVLLFLSIEWLFIIGGAISLLFVYNAIQLKEIKTT